MPDDRYDHDEHGDFEPGGGLRPDEEIDYRVISRVDLTALEGLDDAALAAHFAALAGRATNRQLSRFLDGQSFSSLGDGTHQVLVRRYVERRMDTVSSLRRGRAAFSDALDDALGVRR